MAALSGDIQIRLLGPDDEELLERAGADVFDHAVRPELAVEFLSDPRHHLVGAIDDGVLIGFASGVHYVHPDKAPELWIAEVGVVEGRRREGVGTAVTRALLEHGRRLGCREAWVLTETDNEAARALYASTGASEPADTVVMYRWSLSRE